MKSLPESIRELCSALSDNAHHLQAHAERFLSCADAETMLGLEVTKQKAEVYQKAYGDLLVSLLATLEHADTVASSLSCAVSQADAPEHEPYERAIYQKWEQYERYRAMIIHYLESTRSFVDPRAAQKELPYVRLVGYTRDLAHNARVYAEEFPFDFPTDSCQTNRYEPPRR